MSRPPINDHWTLHLELLGMDKAALDLAHQIVACAPPYAICVHGKWGSGKTSMMRYAMAALGGKPMGVAARPGADARNELPSWLSESWDALQSRSERCVWQGLQRLVEDGLRGDVDVLATQLGGSGQPAFTKAQEALRAERLPLIYPVWFNPWQHQGSATPIHALLHEIRAQFTGWSKALLKAQKLAEVTVEAGLGLLGDLIGSLTPDFPKLGESSGKALTGIRGVGEAWEKNNFYTLSDAQRFNILFETAIRRLLGVADANNPLKDRSGHPIASRRLVVFIDDLDRCSEAQAVALIEGIKLYLQTSHCVFVFGVDSLALRRAVQKTVSGADHEIAREYIEKLFQSVVHVPTPGRPQPFLQDLCERVDLPIAAVPTLVQLTERNPRKMKNFVNAAAAAWRLARRHEAEVDDFLLLFYLQTYHPEVARLIAYDPGHIVQLQRALTRKTLRAPADASPVEVFIVQQFRHAFDDSLGGGDDKTQKFVDDVVGEVRTRLDRLRTDREFVKLWNNRFHEDPPDESLVRRYLHAEQA